MKELFSAPFFVGVCLSLCIWGFVSVIKIECEKSNKFDRLVERVDQLERARDKERETEKGSR